MSLRTFALVLICLPSTHSLNLPNLANGYRDAATACVNIVKDPNSSDSWRRLGKLLHGKGRLDASCKALRRATELLDSGDDAGAHVDLANVLRSIGRFDEAAKALDEAERISGRRDQSLCYARAPAGLDALASDLSASSGKAEESERVWVTRIASAEECRWVIETAEAHCAEVGGWGNPPPRFAPAGTVADNVRAPHLLVADCPALLKWYNAKLEEVIWPLLSQQFGEEVTSAAWMYDAFLLKFDGKPGQQGLGLHVDDDGLGLSTNLLLSDVADFEGGGTLFTKIDGETADDFVVTPQMGELVTHHGGLKHASVPTSAGTRYILVAFARSPPLTVSPPSYIEGNYCAASRAEAAAVAAL